MCFTFGVHHRRLTKWFKELRPLSSNSKPAAGLVLHRRFVESPKKGTMTIRIRSKKGFRYAGAQHDDPL